MSVNWQNHDDYPELALHAESRGDRDLEPARGIANGLLFAAACWGALGLAVLAFRWWVR
jgi:fatty acid desaturase